MTAFKLWVLSVMAVSVVGTILVAITEKTSGAVVVKAVVSMCLVLTLASPLDGIKWRESSFSVQIPDAVSYANTANETAVLTAQRLEEYLTQYAQALGGDCDIHVNYTVSEDMIFSVTDVVVFTENLSGDKRTRLTDKIVEELGIPEKSVAFYEEYGENNRN